MNFNKSPVFKRQQDLQLKLQLLASKNISSQRFNHQLRTSSLEGFQDARSLKVSDYASGEAPLQRVATTIQKVEEGDRSTKLSTNQSTAIQAAKSEGKTSTNVRRPFVDRQSSIQPSTEEEHFILKFNNLPTGESPEKFGKSPFFRRKTRQLYSNKTSKLGASREFYRPPPQNLLYENLGSIKMDRFRGGEESVELGRNLGPTKTFYSQYQSLNQSHEEEQLKKSNQFSRIKPQDQSQNPSVLFATSKPSFIAGENQVSEESYSPKKHTGRLFSQDMQRGGKRYGQPQARLMTQGGLDNQQNQRAFKSFYNKPTQQFSTTLNQFLDPYSQNTRHAFGIRPEKSAEEQIRAVKIQKKLLESQTMRNTSEPPSFKGHDSQEVILPSEKPSEAVSQASILKKERKSQPVVHTKKKNEVYKLIDYLGKGTLTNHRMRNIHRYVDLKPIVTSKSHAGSKLARGSIADQFQSHNVSQENMQEILRKASQSSIGESQMRIEDPNKAAAMAHKPYRNAQNEAGLQPYIFKTPKQFYNTNLNRSLVSQVAKRSRQQPVPETLMEFSSHLKKKGGSIEVLVPKDEDLLYQKKKMLNFAPKPKEKKASIAPKKKITRIFTRNDFRLQQKSLAEQYQPSSARSESGSSDEEQQPSHITSRSPHSITKTPNTADIKRVGMAIVNEQAFQQLQTELRSGSSNSDVSQEREASEDEMTKSELENDRITGLKLKKYLMPTDVVEITAFLEEQVQKRKKDSKIEFHINALALETESSPEFIRKELGFFIAKRLHAEKEKFKKQKCGILGLQGPLRCALSECIEAYIEKERVNEVEFQRAIKMNKHYRVKPPPVEEELDQFEKERRLKERIKDLPVCSHVRCTEDIVVECIGQYKQFHKFRETVQNKLEFWTGRSIRTSEIVSTLEEILTKENKTELDGFPLELLKHPMLHIVERIGEEAEQQNITPRKKGAADVVSRAEHILEQNREVFLEEGATLSLKMISTIIQKEKEAEARKRLKQITEEEQQQQAKQDFQTKLIEDKLRKANKRVKNAKIKGYQNVHQLIQNNVKKAQMTLEDEEPNSQVFKETVKKMEKTEILNSFLMVRLEVCYNAIKSAVQFSNPRLEEKTDLNEDEIYQLRDTVDKIDETLSIKTREQLVANITQINQFKALRLNLLAKREEPKSMPATNDSYSALASQDNILVTGDESQSKSSRSRRKSKREQLAQDIKIPAHPQDIFGEVQASDHFFAEAKREALGNNKPPTKDSEFFRSCQARKLLPMPLFKCIENNRLRIQSKFFGQGFAECLFQLIANNEEPSKHILYLSLDDCKMQDQDFGIILQAIMSSKSFDPALQSVHYSNNFIGSLSAASIGALLARNRDLENHSFVGLSELKLANVKFVTRNDLRSLVSHLANNAKNNQIKSLSMVDIDLNDAIVIEALCRFFKESTNCPLLKLTLSRCKLQPSQIITLISQINTDFIPLRALDISGNPFINLKNETKMKAQIEECIEHLGVFLQDDVYLRHLNLSGLHLGPQLVRLIPFVKENKQVQSIDLSNNGLAESDVHQIEFQLKVVSEAPLQAQQCLLATDPCLANAFTFFKQNFLREQSFSMDLDKFLPKSLTTPKTQEQVFDQIISSGAQKQFRNESNLKSKLTQPAAKAIANLSSSKIRENLQLATRGFFKIQRKNFNLELVFNELGRDRFDILDFNKPSQWRHSAPLLQPSFGSFLDFHRDDPDLEQYLVVQIDKQTVQDQFYRLTDEGTLGLLDRMYGFSSLNSTQPIVFGSMTDWRCFETLPLFKYALLLLTQMREEREHLEDFCFNPQFNFVKYFEQTAPQIYQLYDSYLKVKHAIIIGESQFGEYLPRNTKEELIMNRLHVMARFVNPGKHSVFVRMPDGAIYFKKLLVEIPTPESYLFRISHKQKYFFEHFRSSSEPGPRHTQLELLLSTLSHCALRVEAHFSTKEDLTGFLRDYCSAFPILVECFTEALRSLNWKTYPWVDFKQLRESVELELPEAPDLLSLEDFTHLIVSSFLQRNLQLSFQQYVNSTWRPFLSPPALAPLRKLDSEQTAIVLEYLKLRQPVSPQALVTDLNAKFPKIEHLLTLELISPLYLRVRDTLSDLQGSGVKSEKLKGRQYFYQFLGDDDMQNGSNLENLTLTVDQISSISSLIAETLFKSENFPTLSAKERKESQLPVIPPKQLQAYQAICEMSAADKKAEVLGCFELVVLNHEKELARLAKEAAKKKKK